jgi:peptidoglycan-associated lipoprotein
MINLGVPANRLSIISYGKEKPIANGSTESDFQKNRRANFVPLGQ